MSFESPEESSRWSLKDDATLFSQVVRRVRRDGPQYVSVEGLGEVVVLSREEFSRLRGEVTGRALVDAFAASPHRDIEITADRGPMPVRDPSL